MLPPPMPPNEADRLWQLRSLELLDTPPEERFERITRLALRLFHVPISTITLVDEDRQWFKSRQGLDVEQTIRDISFCGHAILDKGPLLVPDTHLDPRFGDNPLVRGEPHIRFYAGYPLGTPDGSRVGTLTVMDHVPRHLTEEDIGSLRDLARITEQALVSDLITARNKVTGLANGQGFRTLAQHSLDLCARRGQDASLVLIELSGVNAIHSRYGSHGVYQALQHFATELQKTLRDSDLVGHPVETEFLVLLPGTAPEAAARVVSRLRGELARTTRKGRHRYQLAFEAGVLDCGRDRQPIEILLHQVASLKERQKNWLRG